MILLDIIGLFSNESVINFFSIFLTCVFLINIYAIIAEKNNQKTILSSFLDNVGGIYLSIGVFGTFLGITIGLLDFNVKNIEESIPPLLEGLKISFLTSLLGVFFNIISQKMSIFFLKQKYSDETTALNDLLKMMSENNRLQKENNILSKENLDESRIWQENFIEHFQKFNDNLSKQATDQIVSALKKW